MAHPTARASLLLALAAIVGAVTGSVLGAASNVAYLVVAVPAAAGAVAGLGTARLVTWLRLPGKVLGSAAGGIGGVASVAALLVVGWSLARADVMTELSGVRGLGDAAVERAMAEWDASHAGGGTFGFVRYRIGTGARLFGDVTLDLGATGNAVVLLLEIAVAAAAGARLAGRRAAEPFCARCGDWHTRRIVGTAPLGSQSSLVAALAEGQYHRLGRRLEAPDRTLPVVLHGWLCDRCTSGSVRFELEVAMPGERPHVVRTEVAGHEALDAILESRALKTSGPL